MFFLDNAVSIYNSFTHILNELTTDATDILNAYGGFD